MSKFNPQNALLAVKIDEVISTLMIIIRRALVFLHLSEKRVLVCITSCFSPRRAHFALLLSRVFSSLKISILSFYFRTFCH